MTDTISAIATGPARAAIGILRLSGPGALAALSAVFTPQSGRPLSDYPPRQLVYGTLRDSGGRPEAYATIRSTPVATCSATSPRWTPTTSRGIPVNIVPETTPERPA